MRSEAYQHEVALGAVTSGQGGGEAHQSGRAREPFGCTYQDPEWPTVHQGPGGTHGSEELNLQIEGAWRYIKSLVQF